VPSTSGVARPALRLARSERGETRRFLHEDPKVIATQGDLFGNAAYIMPGLQTIQGKAQLNMLAYGREAQVRPFVKAGGP
jgi:hypothetical protein